MGGKRKIISKFKISIFKKYFGELSFDQFFAMIFAFLLFEGIVGSPRKLNSAFPSFPSALRRSIQQHADVGHMLTHYSSSCPYSNANRCNIEAGTLFSRSKCEWLEYFEECDLDGSENCQGFFRDQKNSWSMKWETCDDKVIASIRSLLDWAVGFDRDEKGHGNSCLPMTWHGPETCNYPESRGNLHRIIYTV